MREVSLSIGALVLLSFPGAGALQAGGAGPPALFVENAGQLDEHVLYSSLHGAVRAHFLRDGIALELAARARAPSIDTTVCCAGPDGRVPPSTPRVTAVRLSLEGGRSDASVEGLEPLPGRCSFFRGADPARWVTGARTFARLRYRELLPGVDLEVYHSGGGLEYDVLLGPGALAESLVLRVEGAEDLVEAEGGALVVETRAGQLRQSPPRVVAWRDGRWMPVAGRFTRIDRQRFGFALDGREPGEPCRIDPELQWSTFLGGSGEDQVVAAVVDASGCPVLTGYTASSDFPDTGAIPSPRGDWDVFVTRLSPDASVVLYSAVFGGSFGTDPEGGGVLPGNDGGGDVTVDAAGRITLIGLTGSQDFPATPGAFDTSYNGGIEANELGDTFLVRLDPALAGAAQLVYSSYLGGSLIDNGFDLVVDAAGDVTIAGHCHSPEFPTTPGSFQPVINAPGPGDAFVCRLSLDGTGHADLLWSTFLGGSGYDYGYGLALDAAGRAWICGDAGVTPDFPVTPGSFDVTHNGAPECFVAVLDPNLSGPAQLRYSTYLGGSAGDTLYDLVRIAPRDVVVAGYSRSPDLPVKPVPGAFDTTANGGRDVFVARLSLDAQGADDLVWCTYLGGSDEDLAQRVRLGAGGTVTIAGFTESSDFPVTPGAIQDGHGGGTFDAFVTRIGAHGDRLAFSSYLGGAADDQALGLALDALGNALVVGGTASADFPRTASVAGVVQAGGPLDGFATRLCPEDCAATASVSFQPVALSDATVVLQLTAIGRPTLGSGEFALQLSGAPPLASGSWVLQRFPGSYAGAFPGPRLGHVASDRIALTTDAEGKATLPWPVACDRRPCGAVLRLRAVVTDAGGPNGRSESAWCTIRFGS